MKKCDNPSLFLSDWAAEGHAWKEMAVYCIVMVDRSH